MGHCQVCQQPQPYGSSAKNPKNTKLNKIESLELGNGQKQSKGQNSYSSAQKSSQSVHRGQHENLIAQRKIANSKRSADYDFESWFPILTQTLIELEQLTNFDKVREELEYADFQKLSQGTRSFLQVNMQRVIQAVDDEIDAVLGSHWRSLKSQSENLLASHTILTIWRAKKEVLFAELSDEKKNVCMWACLLHDIAKRGSPCIMGRDHIHAFRSAEKALEVFQRLGILTQNEPDSPQDSHCDQLKRLIRESVQPLPAIWREDFKHGVPVVTLMSSHHNLAEIFHYLWELKMAPRGSFVDQVFRLVLFSHSLEVIEDCPNLKNLSVLEQNSYCDEHFYEIMQILQIADNEAYIIFDELAMVHQRLQIVNSFQHKLQPSDSAIKTNFVAQI